MFWLLALMGMAAAGTMVMTGKDSDDDDRPEPTQLDEDVERIDLSDIDPNLTGELISGSDGDDVMFGGGGTDLMFGNQGNDQLIGGSGNDILVDDEGSDTLTGDGGDDLLFGAGLLDVDGLQGMFDNPPVTVSGLASAIGGSFDGTMTDTDDDPDTLDGGDGDDTIFGGSGDLMIGGAGSDLFIGGEYVEPGAPVTVLDFNPGEDILVYATETGEAGDLSISYAGEPGEEDAIISDGNQHVMTVRGVGTLFTLDDVMTLNQI
ncbi:hypothetical protein KUV73_01600 [Mameliella alba]|nr:hypothetical protein [Mameliella alba]MBY6168011.1 hypothetical protein [Mameliella alba]MBY6173032.1 hypothetical protein [Mameliella alba]